MRLVKVKEASKVELIGVEVDFQVVDNNVEAVTITDIEGNSIRICKSESYGTNLSVMIPQPQVEEEHVFVVGTLVDIEVSKDFGVSGDYDNETAATEYACQLNGSYMNGPVGVVRKNVLVDPVKI